MMATDNVDNNQKSIDSLLRDIKKGVSRLAARCHVC